MAEAWWFKFEWDAWRNDAALRKCAMETQGVWLRLVMEMYAGGVAELAGTPESLARLIGCFPAEIERALAEIEAFNVAIVKRECNAGVTPVKRECNADVTVNVTVISRRLSRELNERKQTSLRVRQHRSNGKSGTVKRECNANVTLVKHNGNAAVTPIEFKDKSLREENTKELRSLAHTRARQSAPTTEPAIQSSAITAFWKMFPNVPLAIYQQELIADKVANLNVWQQTLETWKANGNVAAKIGNVLERYERQLAKNETGNSGTNQTARERQETWTNDAKRIEEELFERGTAKRNAAGRTLLGGNDAVDSPNRGIIESTAANG